MLATQAPKLIASLVAVTLIAGGATQAAFARSDHHRHHHPHHHHRHNGIPQHNGGDRDSDNNGRPSDNDGNI